MNPPARVNGVPLTRAGAPGPDRCGGGEGGVGGGGVLYYGSGGAVFGGARATAGDGGPAVVYAVGRRSSARLSDRRCGFVASGAEPS